MSRRDPEQRNPRDGARRGLQAPALAVCSMLATVLTSSVLMSTALTSCSSRELELDVLARYEGKYVAFSRDRHYDRHARTMPFGVYIERRGGEYLVGVWYDDIAGERVLPAHQIVVYTAPTTGARAYQYYRDDAKTVKLRLRSFGRLRFEFLTQQLANDLQQSFWKAFTVWNARKLSSGELATTDMYEVRERVGRAEDVEGARITWEGTVAAIDQQQEPRFPSLYRVTLRPRQGVAVVLLNSHKANFTSRTAGEVEVVPSFANLKIGATIAYKGTIANVLRPETDGAPVVLELGSVVYR